jgi:2-polyprenyl-6-hydroxyphenyl methylase/3-demethylubiquinone-9 3-methyltransferase
MKVDDIRPERVMDGQRVAMQADVDWLAARTGEYVPVACPACGSDVAERLYEKYTMQHRLCAKCGMQYVSPRPSEATLAAFYAQSANYAYWAKYVFPESSEARRQQIFKPRAEHLARIATERGVRGGTLVEVGAAHGLFCDEIRKLDVFSNIVAIEPTPDMAQTCRDLGFETYEAPFEQVKLKAGADAVANFEVIEHLFDPGAFLRWSHDLLRPGGILFLTCPNSAGFEIEALGKESNSVDHEHVNMFTPDSLARLAERSGFRNVEMTTPGRLDVEIVRAALPESESRERLGEFFARLVYHSDPAILARLQDLIADAGLSSHMCLVAERAA